MRGDAASAAEIRALQIVVAVLSLIPLSAGAAGIVLGPAFNGIAGPWPANLDSHFRFLSGIFLAVGIGFLSTVTNIATATGRFRLLAALVFAGGCARLISLAVAGPPSTGHLAGLALELVVVPLLVLWQARIASQNPR